MAIFFDCPACRRRIQVPDEAAGAQALCPFCRNRVTVPEQSQPPLSASSAPMSPATTSRPGDSSQQAYPPHEPYEESGNPYEPPPIDEDRPYEPPPIAPATDPVPTIIPVGRMMSSAWFVFTTFFLHHLVFGLAVFACSCIMVLLCYAPFIISIIMAGGGEPSQESFFIAGAIVCVLGLIMVFIGPFLFCGMINYGLYKMRGGKNGVERIFQGGRFFLRGIGLGLLLWVISVVPMMLTMIPMFLMVLSLQANDDPGAVMVVAALGGYALGAVISLIVWIRLGFSWFFLVDRDMGVFDSLGTSWTFTKGNALALFLTSFVFWLLLGALSQCCYFGALLAPSFFLLASALLYLKITGQPNVMFDPEEATERW